jgi:mannan endo-1,4-beta-mannosidase
VRARDGARSAEAERAFRYDTFVRRDGNRLALDGERYRFIGLSVPDLHTAAFRHLAVGGEDPVEEVMREAQALGVRVLRVRAFDDRPDAPSAIQSGPGEHPRAGLTALDRIVEQAAGHGIKLILTLVGHNDAYGGPTQYLRWAGYASPVPADHPLFYLNPQIREAVKSHVAFLLTRVHPQTGLSYANEPAIMGWEVMDGLDGQGVLDPENGGTEANQFLQDLTEHVRALAPNQLVGTGEFGFDVNPNPYGAAWGPLRDAGLSALLDGTRAVAFSRNVALETVDYGGFQALPDTWQFPDASNGIANLGAWWVRGHAAVAVGAGRPVVLTNAAMRHGGGLGARRVALRAWFDEVLALDLDGFIVGELYPDAIDLPAGPEAWRFDATQPFDSPSNVYADLIRTFADELTAAP